MDRPKPNTPVELSLIRDALRLRDDRAVVPLHAVREASVRPCRIPCRTCVASAVGEVDQIERAVAARTGTLPTLNAFQHVREIFRVG